MNSITQKYKGVTQRCFIRAQNAGYKINSPSITMLQGTICG